MVGKSFVSLHACLFYYRGIANLRKRILLLSAQVWYSKNHQYLTNAPIVMNAHSPSNEYTDTFHWINSAACLNHGKPRRLLCNTQFYFRFHNTLSEICHENQAIQACLLSCNRVQYLLQNISEIQQLFLFRKENNQDTCVCDPDKYWLIQKYVLLYLKIKSFRSF